MSVREMIQEDMGFALSLIRKEGWGHTRIDLERMLSLTPDGSYIWECEGVPHGFVTSVRYGNTAMIGHLIVSSDSRGRQVGKGLMKTLLEDIDSAGISSTMLYATAEGSKLYHQFGFVESGHELVAVGLLIGEGERSALRSQCTMVQDGDLDEVVSLDRETFGDDRPNLIMRLYRDFPEHCFKIERSGDLIGFAFGRRTTIGFDIGPWLCAPGHKEDAESLLDSVIRSFPYGGRTDISPFSSNQDVHGILDRFHHYRKAANVKLMVRGDPRYEGSIDRVFGVAGFEIG
ncbi:MAG: GNAT family N-acetyltransferase [Thermoplasmata archaeon]|nr:GNAT family N-acetyltransferase [Thermoplasmata archaeon]